MHVSDAEATLTSLYNRYHESQKFNRNDYTTFRNTVDAIRQQELESQLCDAAVEVWQTTKLEPLCCNRTRRGDKELHSKYKKVLQAIEPHIPTGDEPGQN